MKTVYWALAENSWWDASVYVSVWAISQQQKTSMLGHMKNIGLVPINYT